MFKILKLLMPKTHKQKKRMCVLWVAFSIVAFGAFLTLHSIKNFIVYYYTPSEVIKNNIVVGKTYRIGGLVKRNSIKLEQNKISFLLIEPSESSDYELTVIYNGTLPSLFREGVGAIAEGKFSEDGIFNAHLILAKHDEVYQPPTS